MGQGDARQSRRPVHLLPRVAPAMIAQNYGRIVNIASIAGKEGNPNASAYSASKAGVIALTKSLGKELAALRHRGQLRDAGGGQDRDLRPDDAGAHRLHAVEDPARALRQGGRDRGAGARSAPRRTTPSPPARCSTFPAGGRRIDPARKRHRDRLTGIALMCGAVALFACLDATAKYLNTHMHTVQVVWARYMAAFALAIVLLNPTGNPGVMTTGRAPSSAARRCCWARRCSTSCALRYLQLDEAMAIAFSTPFIVAALAGPLLGEWIGWRRWTAIVVGFPACWW